MTRNDIGRHASFGGGDVPPVGENRKQSVVLVHGLAGSAGTLEAQRQYLLKAGFSFQYTGWNKSDVYGTTYGNGERTLLYQDSLKCEHVKQIRSFIQAVAAYTKGQVDIIGYSMGSPISRKAILGGKCVDTGEYLGPPLTALVDTFVSVAGDSSLQPRYEGHHIFSIYSEQDEIIGYRNTCGSIAASITGADKEFETFGSHAQVMVDSVPMQANLIATHRADGR
ncbi:triacylglycerol lipase [Cooperia oncophora]